jgi:hypothetical protein
MTGISNMGIISTKNKDLYHNIQHMCDYAGKTVKQSITTTNVLYVISTLQLVYFNNFIEKHFIIPLSGTITKSYTCILNVKEKPLPHFFPCIKFSTT